MGVCLAAARWPRHRWTHPGWGDAEKLALASRSALGIVSRRAQALLARVMRRLQLALGSAARAEPRLGRFAAIGSMFLILLLIVLGLSSVPRPLPGQDECERDHL